jgi:N-acetylmuramic acid 6-phosphate (MurNAc-6-P) etherase
MIVNTKIIKGSSSSRSTFQIMPWSTVTTPVMLETGKVFHRIMVVVKAHLPHLKARVVQDGTTVLWASEVFAGGAISASMISCEAESVLIEVENKTSEQGEVEVEYIIETFNEPDAIERLGELAP